MPMGTVWLKVKFVDVIEGILWKNWYNRAAKIFDLTEAMMEKGKMRQWREMVWIEAKGKVLEVGVGPMMYIHYIMKLHHKSILSFCIPIILFILTIYS